MAASNNPGVRISAIITAYNSAEFIGEAIESVLAQTRPVDEIVVVDDGSSDNTADIVLSYASANVQYIHQDNQGPGAARNRGISETSGELVAFLDADDVWLADKTDKQTNYLVAHPEIALVSSDMWWWDTKTNKRWIKRFTPEPRANLAREIVVHNIVGNPSVTLIRREAFSKVGLFNPSLRWGQDWELWIRIVSQMKIGYISEPLIIYRRHAASISRQRQEERLSTLLEISRQAIATYQPAWWRPILSARAWSDIEYYYALYTPWHRSSRQLQLWHSARAFFSYPFENTSEKAKLLAKAILGEALYNRLIKYSGLRRLRPQLKG